MATGPDCPKCRTTITLAEARQHAGLCGHCRTVVDRAVVKESLTTRHQQTTQHES